MHHCRGACLVQADEIKELLLNSPATFNWAKLTALETAEFKKKEQLARRVRTLQNVLWLLTA